MSQGWHRHGSRTLGSDSRARRGAKRHRHGSHHRNAQEVVIWEAPTVPDSGWVAAEADVPTAPFRVYRTVIAMLNLRRGLTSPGLAPPPVAHAGERFSCAPGRTRIAPRSEEHTSEL